MNPAQSFAPPSFTPLPGKIMFVCDMESPDESILQECEALCDALAASGVPAVLFRAWGRYAAQAAGLRAAKIQEQPYAIYCSHEVRSAAPLLALLEQPSLAVTLGWDPVGVAQTLLDAGTPCIAWFFDEVKLRCLPPGKVDQRIGLAAASSSLARQLTVLAGQAASALLPPLPTPQHISGAGDTILLPATRRIGGIQRMLEIARLRPQYRFVALTGRSGDCALQAGALQAPPNILLVDGSKTPPPARLALLPSINAELPWKLLAECLTAGIPFLASNEALLVETLGEASICLPATAELNEWLRQLDHLMRDDPATGLLAGMSAQAVQKGRQIRLPAVDAAAACHALFKKHLEGRAPVPRTAGGRL